MKLYLKLRYERKKRFFEEKKLKMFGVIQYHSKKCSEWYGITPKNVWSGIG